MPYVIVEGTGDYGSGSRRFKPGSTEVDAETASAVLADQDLPTWVRVSETRAPLPGDPVPPAAAQPDVPTGDRQPGSPFVVYGGRNGKWYFNDATGTQSEPLDTREAADAEAEAARVAADQARQAAQAGAQRLAEEERRRLEVAAAEHRQVPDAAEIAAEQVNAKSPADQGGTTCPDCGQGFATEAQRDNHVRIKHPRERA